MNAVTDFPPIIEDAGTLAVPVVSIKSAVLAQFADAEKTVTALAEKYRSVAYDCTTTKGMADAKAARLDLRENGRYAVQRAEAKVKTEVNDLKRVMAGEVGRLVAIVRPVEDAIDGQIKAREEQLAAEKAERERQAAEAARIEAERRQRLEDGITTLAGYVGKAQRKTADEILRGIAFVEGIRIEADHWQEYTERAQAQKDATLAALRELHAATVKAEADAAELEALRREKAEREALEAAVLKAIVGGIRAESRRVEWPKNPAYIRKAMVTFESMAPDWENDPREAVREAIAEGRRYLGDLMVAAQAEAGRAAQAAEQDRLAREHAELEAERIAALTAGAPKVQDAEMVLADEPITTRPASGGGQVDGCRAPESQPDGCSGPVSQDQTSLPASPHEPVATFKLGDITDRLGFNLTRSFVESLGIKPVATPEAAVLFSESDWPRLCDALVAHVQAKRGA